MIPVGEPIGRFNLSARGEEIYHLYQSLNRNKLLLMNIVDNVLDIGTANDEKYLNMVGFKRWRVIACFAHFTEASTANEDPVVEFGRIGDPNAYATLSCTITGGEKFCISDTLKYDPLNLLSNEVITESSATLVVTWTEGVEFGVWNDKEEILEVIEAAVPAMTSGKLRCALLVEVDSQGVF